MITEKNSCCNDHTLVQSRQRSRNDMTVTTRFHYQRFVETSDKATSLQNVSMPKRHNHFVKPSLYPLPPQCRSKWELYLCI